MDFTREWKSLWPVSSTFSAPVLIPNKSHESPIGPLIFTPMPSSSTMILHSPYLSPRLPPPYPSLSLSRFIRIYNSVSLTSSSVPSLLGAELLDYSSSFHGFNCLQLLRIPNRNLIVAFFLTGENSNTVGFSLLHVRDGILSVRSQMDDLFHVAKGGNLSRHRITLFLVNPVDEFCCDGTLGDVGIKPKTVTVGFLMVCSQFSVFWYEIAMNYVCGQKEYPVRVDYLGCADAKNLLGNMVVSACWNPHLKEECLVLLGNGDLLLFEVNSSLRDNAQARFLFGGINRAINKRMHISLTDKLGLEKEEGRKKVRDWLKCEFSWHPRILIAANRSEVFLVDLRSSEDCGVRFLLKLDMLSEDQNDGFFALSRACLDGFSFTVATKHLLLLCDVRRPLMPVLRWAHCIPNPRYVEVFRLSDLRANAESTEYKLASELGYCIMLGSFWDNEFSLFCYGPECKGNESLSSKISKMCYSYNAWGLPSELSLSDCACKCGSCLVREEFAEMSRPVWVDWRQKKHLALGFCILEADISAQLLPVGSFGGFVLIRLTSCGKLEAQPYHAAWEPENFREAGHKRKSADLEENRLYDATELEFEGVKKMQHIKLIFLDAFRKGKIEEIIVNRREKIEESDERAGSRKGHFGKSDWNFHKEMCHKLKGLGPLEARSSVGISVVLGDISWPMSVHEIGLMSVFAALPTGLLRSAFAVYSDFDMDHGNEPLEFLDIPDQPQAPPFPFRRSSFRSNRWSTRVQPPDALVGPVIPPLFLTALYRLLVEERKSKRELYPEKSEAFSTHVHFKSQCEKVMEAVSEHIAENREDDYVSLADDIESMESLTQKSKFSFYKPSAFSESPSCLEKWEPGPRSCIFSTHVFGRSEFMESDIGPGMVGKELFDAGCPIRLKFEDLNTDFGPKELETLRNLKQQDMDFQKSFKPYQDYINRSVSSSQFIGLHVKVRILAASIEGDFATGGDGTWEWRGFWTLDDSGVRAATSGFSCILHRLSIGKTEP
ncbi:Unknown protein [Striga hermonthica]|uniref:Uncharacterized protein n=1 Tax=Striga hermonthica TaxID=68872 RepID=A0A9N7MJL8_STRHE|nr:Unknown protein [Striga hermonthica]